MFMPLHRTGLFICALLVPVLLNGCAGTGQPPAPSQQQPASAVAEQQPAAEPISPTYQQALNAYEENDFHKAVARFQQANSEETLSDLDLYYYAHALYQTENYAEALNIYNQYLDKLGRRGDNFLAALNERTEAQEKLQQQQAAEARAAQAKEAFSQVSQALEANWLTVQTQIGQRAPSFTEPLTGIEMLLVEGGCYQMGDQFGDGEAAERPVHQVCVDDFYLGKYEVTQAQWQKLMGYNPSQSNQGDEFPVESISWQEAAEFTRKLSGTAGSYRLPTEAEWEYAARSGGEKENFSGGGSVDEVAWYEDNSASASHPVGQKKVNGLGFFDMSGNVYEWCLDRFEAAYYLNSPEQNPTGPESGTERTIRGGGWDSRVAYQRTSYRRSYSESEHRADDIGFRLALPLPLQNK